MTDQNQINAIYNREKERLTKKVARQSKGLEETKLLLAQVNALIK